MVSRAEDRPSLGTVNPEQDSKIFDPFDHMVIEIVLYGTTRSTDKNVSSSARSLPTTSTKEFPTKVVELQDRSREANIPTQHLSS